MLWGCQLTALVECSISSHGRPPAVPRVLSAGVISLSAGLTGLMPGATYFYRISAAKTGGAAQLGGVLNFTTVAVPVVGNLAATLDEEAGRYTVRYDVAGVGALTATPQFSLDNGATWLAMQTTSGAVGSGQQAGAGKVLVWSYGADGLRENGALGATLRLRVRATDAANGVGSAEITTAAPATQPTVATLAATLAGSTSGQLQGTVNRHGLGVVSWFEWGSALEALTSRTPTRSVSGPGAVGKAEWIENLKPGTIYYYRMVAVRPGSTAQRGTVKTFTTQEAADKLDAKLTLTASGKPSEVGPKPGFFKITRGGDLSLPMTLTLRMRGKAINGVDYDEIPETLVLAAGAKSAVVTILPKQDSIVEGPETVILLVVPTGSYRSSLKGATLSIREDDKLDGPTMSYPANDAGLPRTPFEKVDTVGEKTGERWYRIAGVPPGTRLNLTVTGPPVTGPPNETKKYRLLDCNVALTLFDETGEEVGQSDNALNNPEFIAERLERGGDYLVAVSYVGALPLLGNIAPKKTKFILTASGGENWALVENVTDENGGEVHHVGLLLSAQSPMSVPNAATWIVSHGRTDEPKTFDGIAAALANAEPGAQVLSVDWRTAAAVTDFTDFTNGRWFVKIGKALGRCLAETQSGAARFRGSELSYVGHSWGTYICYEIARNMQEQRKLGNAPRFVALDPAKEALNYADSAVNFSAFSDYSMGFQSSDLGNEERVADCTAGFYIRTPRSIISDEILRHNVAHYAFRSLLVNDDRISKLFKALLFAGASPVWAKDPGSFHKRANSKTDPVDYTFPGSVDGRFEGVLDAQGKGTKWIFTNFYYEAKP